MLFKESYKILIISAIFLKMAKRTRYAKSVRQLYSGDESLSNLSTLWSNAVRLEGIERIR
jgi:hypothetical protein